MKTDLYVRHKPDNYARIQPENTAFYGRNFHQFCQSVILIELLVDQTKISFGHFNDL